MEPKFLLIKKKAHIATIVLNRPDKRNSLSPDLLLELHQTLQKFGGGDDVRTVIIRGSGDKTFSSGYDITAIPTNIPPELEEKIKDQHPLELAIKSVLDFPYPTIAMLNGYAFGAGCELAVTCDLRVGHEGIRMGMPPAKLGLVYPVSNLMRFINILGITKTKEIFLTARYFDARRARDMGMLDYLVSKEELEEFTWTLAEEMAGNAPLAVKGMKRILGMLARSENLSPEKMREADQIVAEAFNSEDLKEGQTAFLEKRKPMFKGR